MESPASSTYSTTLPPPKPSEYTTHTYDLIPQTHSNQPSSQTTSLEGEIMAKTKPSKLPPRRENCPQNIRKG